LLGGGKGKRVGPKASWDSGKFEVGERVAEFLNIFLCTNGKEGGKKIAGKKEKSSAPVFKRTTVPTTAIASG